MSGPELEAWFWDQVDRSSGPDSCWPWLGFIAPDGYGRVWWRGKVVQAHKIALELATGPLDPGLMALHKCDNPPCCNPGCLSSGTNADNMLDKKVKGRSARGTQSGRSKLTEADVLEIRRAYAAGESSQPRLAAKFHVHAALISRVVNRRNWKHI
jgi:hypothetical protein